VCRQLSGPLLFAIHLNPGYQKSLIESRKFWVDEWTLLEPV